MQNLAKAIENRKISLVLAKLNARDTQCITLNPSPSLYFDESNRLTFFYANLNRYFLTHNQTCLDECYKVYFELENQGWVIERGRFVNPLFRRLLDKIDLIVEAWFYRYAINLNFEWLQNSLEIIIKAEIDEFKALRLRADIKPTSTESFKRQVDMFPEMMLLYLIQRKKEEYLQVTVFRLGLSDWDYRKPVIFEGVSLFSTEINVPSIEVDLNEAVYDKVRLLGLIWANKYITEPSARNAFIKLNGL